MKKNYVATVALTAVIVFLLSGLFYSRTYFGRFIYAEMAKSSVGSGYSKFMQIETLLDEKYMGERPEDKMMENAYEAYVATLDDPYTTYLNQKNFKQMREKLNGDYVGIGVELGEEDNKIKVIGVNPGSPAEKAGILPGDLILAIDSVEYSYDRVEEVIAVIKGAKTETPLLLKLERGGDILELSVTTGEVEIKYIVSDMLEGNIGYIRIKTFGNSVYEDFKESLENLTAQKMKGLIIDLRSNPGGSLDQVVKLTDLLVPEGVITTVKKKDGTEEKYKSDENEIDVPMCVLTNSGSASASEVMSGALRDFKKATLIGEKTFGKGVVQGIFEFSDATALRITIAKYYTPSGECIHGSGIKPDIEVKLPEGMYISDFDDDIKKHMETDTQLQKAIEVING